jgi:hypothetical protein
MLPSQFREDRAGESLSGTRHSGLFKLIDNAFMFAPAAAERQRTCASRMEKHVFAPA